MGDSEDGGDGADERDGERRRRREAELVRLFRGAPIVQTFGMELRFDEEGRAVVRLPFNPDLDHAIGGIHGGALATLLDTAGWFTVAARHDTWIATVEFHTRLLEPVAKVDLEATGWIVRPGSRISAASMEVRSEEGERVAVGSGSFYITSRPFTPSEESS